MGLLLGTRTQFLKAKKLNNFSLFNMDFLEQNNYGWLRNAFLRSLDLKYLGHDNYHTEI